MAEYEETARVALVNGTVFNGTRRYLYRRPERPDGLQILFYETGELFLSLEFHDKGDGRWHASANHLCKADLYHSKYGLYGENHFHVQHEVSGPRKNYIVRSIYSRAARSDFRS
jgi:uncharacterized protein DUF6314